MITSGPPLFTLCLCLLTGTAIPQASHPHDTARNGNEAALSATHVKASRVVDIKYQVQGTPYEPIWTRNAKLADKLQLEAAQLRKGADRKSREHLLGRGPLFEAWQKLTEAVQLSDDPFLLRDFCDSSFDAERYRDVVWSARKMSEESNWALNISARFEWGFSLAVLGDYEGAAKIIQEGLEKAPKDDDWSDYFREWTIIFTYLTKDFFTAREEARKHPTKELAKMNLNVGANLNGGVWNLLAKRIHHLIDKAESHKMQYQLLSHLSQMHRLIRDGLEGYRGGGVSASTVIEGAPITLYDVFPVSVSPRL